MKKLILLSFLTSLIIMLGFTFSAAAIDINSTADPNTSHIEQLFSDNTPGRIEIDKTVQYNENEYINTLNYGISDFSITLSAIGQDYIQNVTEIEEGPKLHPDIMFVVDVSSSMKENMNDSNMNRVQSTTQALNLAINSLMAQDPETRWGVVSFGNNYYTASQRAVGTYRSGFFTRNYNAPAGLYLPIHKYTSSNGNYFSYSNNKISSNQLRDENNRSYASTSYTINRDGTYTQAGLYAAYQSFTQVTDTTNRYPVIILITDGVPTIIDKDIWPISDYPGTSDTAYNSTQFRDRNLEGHGYLTDTNEEFFGLTIETALRLKKEVSELYNRQALYITIGPGVNYLVGRMFLNPSQELLAAGADNDTTDSQCGSCTPKKLKDWLEANSNEEEYLALTDLSDFSLASNFSLEEYSQAMQEMVEKVFEQHFTPFIDEDSELIITDVITDMIIKSTPKIYLYGEILEPTSIENNQTIFNYKYNIKVEVNDNTLTWTIPTKIVPLFKTNDFANTQPIRLIYSVGLSRLDELKTYYTNNSAYGAFNVNSNNPYYLNFTNSVTNKEQNLTNTLSYVNQVNNNNGLIEINLGNNGLIEFKSEPQIKSYVLDYGLSIQHTGLEQDNITGELIGIAKTDIDYSLNNQLFGEYGDIVSDFEKNNIIYTLKTLNFTDKDTFFFLYNINQVYDLPSHVLSYLQVNYIPATFIYYEDDFVGIKYNNASVLDGSRGLWYEKFSDENKIIFQNADLVNDLNSNIYGYDQAYDNDLKYSNGSNHCVEVSENMGPSKGGTWPTIEFDFTGTGFDIVSTTDNLSGVLTVTVKDDEGNIIRRLLVDNYYGCVYENDEYVSYPEIKKCIYQIPVLKCTDLEYKHYNVTITAAFTTLFEHYSVDDNEVKNYNLYFDAIRIYNPSNNEDSLNTYKLDKESQPYFEQVKNRLIKNKTLTENYEDGMIFIDGKGAIESSKLFENIDENPNNEIYLAKNHMIAFSLQASEIPNQVAIGLKVVSGDNGSIIKIYKEDATQNIYLNSSTDMYYEIENLKWEYVDGIWQSEVIVIKNNSDSILSLTNIKTTTTPITIMASKKMHTYALNRVQEPVEEKEEMNVFKQMILKILQLF